MKPEQDFSIEVEKFGVNGMPPEQIAQDAWITRQAARHALVTAQKEFSEADLAFRNAARELDPATKQDIVKNDPSFNNGYGYIPR